MIAFTRNEFCLKKLKPDYKELAKREIFGFFVTRRKKFANIARKLRLQKSKCKENSKKSDTIAFTGVTQPFPFGIYCKNPGAEHERTFLLVTY